MEFKSPLPLRLKEARNKAKISQVELGIRIGLEPSSASGRMNHYEKGRHTPDLQTLSRIASQLDVPLNYFFCETEELAEINLLLHRLSENKMNSILTWIKSQGYLDDDF
ncbi:helix-turn-helix domain-containing protein [Alteromonas sp. 345S023]|uniref:Helix-turn-helix domain-containing protein n=1 Tax=Alteromonas profundi TaxID=2696062 RepID=A0A7X5LNZ6_9ALTE|nr:helix-turn-helix transcriptional regulator [Alteromonas profundi]NDV92876.1 helix-turn-helix domain-containing protein [Alteromonas profundi]